MRPSRPAQPPGARGVRARTLRHLGGILALTALASTATEALAGEKTGKSGATKPATAPPTEGLGYSVVDEIPAPATCDDFASAIRARATVLGGQMLLHVEPGRLYDPEYGGSTVVIDGAGVTPVAHGAILSKTAIPDSPGWVFQLAPEPAVQAIALTLPGSCDGEPGGAQIEVRWEGAFTPSSTVAVTIVPSADPGAAPAPTPAPAPPPASPSTPPGATP